MCSLVSVSGFCGTISANLKTSILDFHVLPLHEFSDNNFDQRCYEKIILSYLLLLLMKKTQAQLSSMCKGISW